MAKPSQGGVGSAGAWGPCSRRDGHTRLTRGLNRVPILPHWGDDCRLSRHPSFTGPGTAHVSYWKALSLSVLQNPQENVWAWPKAPNRFLLSC